MATIPKISYRVKRDYLMIRIKTPANVNASFFNTGLSVSLEKFDARKQICGDPKIQTFMDETEVKLKQIFTPEMSPKDLWYNLQDIESKKKDKHLVKDAFKYYFNTCKVSENTIKSIQSVQAKVIIADLYNKPIKDINGAVMREFIASLSHHKQSTIHENYMKFKTVLNRYITENGLEIKLTIDGLFKTPQKDDSEIDYLVWDEVKSLLEVDLSNKKDAYFRDLFCLMCFTGMAVSDLMRFNPKKGISEDGKWFSYVRKKTGSKCDFIPLLPAAREIISRNLWPVKISIRTIQYKCDIISELIGRKVKSHGARKTFGTIMLEYGFSIESVARMMGHSNPIITANIYAHVTSEKIKKEMNNMPPAVKELMEIN